MLKINLLELLDEINIRPTMSPCGAHPTRFHERIEEVHLCEHYYLSNSGSTHQVCTFSTPSKLYIQEIVRLHIVTYFDRVRLRPESHVTLLEGIT
jgi:hypothetical protein